MSFNGQLLATGGVAQCLTDSVQVFGADGTYSNNIAVYQFNGDATDTTGNYSATTQGSPSYVTGKFGQAASLSNSDTDYFTTSISPTILGNSFALSAWVYVTQNSGTSDYYSIAGAYWNGSSGNQSWIFYIANGTLYFFSNLSSGSITVTGGTVPLNQWNFVAFSVNDKNEISVYLNGVRTSSAVSLSLRSNSINLTLGNIGPYNAGRTLYGILDQIRVFDRPLTSSEMNVLYNETDSTTSNTNLLNDGAGVALYTLDYDASDAGGLYDGTSSNVDFGVAGQINYGASFNGSSSYISLPNDFINSFNSGQLFSVSFWFNSDDITKNAGAFSAYDYNGQNHGWTIYTGYSSNKLRFLSYAPGLTTMDINGSTTLVNNTWYHAAVVYDGTGGTGTCTLYLNGNSDGSGTITGNRSYLSNNTYYIGAINNGIGGQEAYYDGILDQVRVFDKALTSDEVSLLHEEEACVYTCTTDTVNYPSTTNTAYYKLDNSAEDETGSYDGTETNIEYRFGRFGQAAVFNGSSSIITATQPSGLNGPCTYSAWLKTTSSSYQSIITVGSVTGSYTAGVNLFVNSGKLSCQTGNGSSTENSNVNSTSDIDTGNWVHCAVVVAGSTQGSSIKVYVNGQEEGSGTADNTAIVAASSESLCLGGRILSGSQSTFLNGSLDQVRIFTSALSADKITELYNEKPCADTSNFNTVLYGGTAANQFISNVGMDLETNGGLVWIKNRSLNYFHALIDSVRGTGQVLSSNSSTLDTTNYTDQLTSFDDNGFFVGNNASGGNYVNVSGSNYVAWVWKGGGDPVNIAVNSITGSTPSVSSDVSANTAAGFSIVKWNGDGTNTQTVGHGLFPSAPEIVIMKSISGNSAWYVLTTVISGTNPAYLRLDSTDIANSATFTSTSTTFTNFAYGGDTIAYCFHSVSGYSKIGSYTGDGTTSGKIIYTTDDGTSSGSNGFEPSFLLTKPVGPTGGYWYILDNRRSTTNPRNDALFPNDILAEISSTNYNVDFLSNGFELKNNSIGFNTLNEGYIFMAFK